MAEKLTLYHNPRCSKSRAALNLLSDCPDLEVVEYLKSPLASAELTELARLVDGGARALLRGADEGFRERGLDDPELPDTRLIAALVEEPALFNRPVARRGDRVVIGRPPENVTRLLENE